MTTAKARVLDPITLTAAHLKTGTTIAEPDAAVGEVAWVASASYTVGDQRTSNGVLWSAKQTHSGRATLPEADVAYWTELRPTNRMRCLDEYHRTQSTATTSLTYVIAPGFFDGIRLSNLQGEEVTVTVKDALGGTTIYTKTTSLYAQADGLYELLFGTLGTTDAASFDGVELHPTAHAYITVTAASGNAVAVGIISMGIWIEFTGSSDFGGAEYGMSAEYKSYTYNKEQADGTYELVPRTPSRNVSGSIVIDAEQANAADRLLLRILNRPVAFEASNMGRYAYLSTFGFVTGSINADTYATSSLNLTVKGNV